MSEFEDKYDKGVSAEKILIVIGRQYGSGGRRIGKMLAERLGISYYDKTLLNKAAEKLGYSKQIFDSKDEKRPSLLRSLLSFNYGSPTGQITETPMSDEKLYEKISSTLTILMAGGGCR